MLALVSLRSKCGRHSASGTVSLCGMALPQACASRCLGNTVAPFVTGADPDTLSIVKTPFGVCEIPNQLKIRSIAGPLADPFLHSSQSLRFIPSHIAPQARLADSRRGEIFLLVEA